MTSAAHTGCDAAVAMGASPASTVKRPRLVLITTILASSLAMIDGSVVNVGLPAIGHTLKADASDLQWVINAYLLPLSALLLLGGALGDRYGRRRLLVSGVTLFALASATCAFAPSIGWLLLGRGVQGIGAAILLPNSLAILGGAFSGEARGRAIGLWAAAGAMAAAIGPVLGGWLIDTIGWPSIFLLNLPLAVAAVVLAWMSVPVESSAERTPLDLAGAVLATASLSGLAWGLTLGSGPGGWTMAPVVAGLAGVALMAAFAWVEWRRGDRAMAPLALFGSRTFIGLSLLTLLLYGVLGGLLVLLPFVLITAGGYSAIGAGAALLPLPLVLMIASPFMGALAGRIGSRLLLTVGSLIVALGVGLATRVGPGESYWTTVLPAVLVVSLGMAGVAAPLTTAVLASVDLRHTGSASGLNSALARTGGLIATALLGSVLAGKGETLIDNFRGAGFVGAGAALAAAACAFLLVGGPTRPEA